MQKIFTLCSLLLLMASPSVLANNPTQAELLAGPARLIETGSGQASWKTPAEIFELSRIVHEAGRCGGFMDITEAQDIKRNFDPALFLLDHDQMHSQQEVEKMIAQLSSDKLHDTVEKLSSFHDRFYQNDTGVQAAAWIAQAFTDLAKGRADVQVFSFRHSFKMPSVIVRIQGQGPLAGEVVVLGAHADSVNQGTFGPVPTALAPGADDDASGVATLLEAFRVIIDSGYRPARSIEFIAYAGEEAGLLGSQAIVKRYQELNKKVVAVLQMDMTMHPGPNRAITLISDNVNTELTNFVKKVIDTYVKAPWAMDKCGYACSDHASWDKAGVPAAFPFESLFKDDNKAIHSDKDVLSILDMNFGLHFAKLTTAFAVELSAGQ